MTVAPGSIIQGPRWPEPIKVDLVEDLGDYVRIVGATVNLRNHIDQVLPKSDGSIGWPEAFRGMISASCQVQPVAEKVFLLTLSILMRTNRFADHIVAVNTSRRADVNQPYVACNDAKCSASSRLQLRRSTVTSHPALVGGSWLRVSFSPN